MDLLGQTVFSSGTALAATAGVMLLAQLVYALSGFGSGLIAVSLGAFLVPDLSLLVPLLLLVNLPTETWVSWRDRRRVSFAGAGWLLPAMLAGLPLGTWLLAELGDRPWAVTLPGPLGGLAGLAAGVAGAMFGTGGPPVILWFQLQGLDKRAFRATLLGVFLVMSIVRVPSYAVAGLLGREVLLSALLLLPAGLLGLLIGQRLHIGIPERRFRQGVALALALLGLGLMV
jgi:uncharacterized membrane protein YfcA